MVRNPARYASGQIRAVSTLHLTIEEGARLYHHVVIGYLRQAMQKSHGTSLPLLTMSDLQIRVPWGWMILYISPTNLFIKMVLLEWSLNPCLHPELPLNRHKLICRVITLDPRLEFLFYCAFRTACTIIPPLISRSEMLLFLILTRPSVL